MDNLNVIHHIHATNEFGAPVYDTATEPWGVVYDDETETTTAPRAELFPENDGNLHWTGIPRPKAASDEHQLIRVDYDGENNVDTYWQDVREVDHRILASS